MKCELCGKEFETNDSRKKYCSRECSRFSCRRIDRGVQRRKENKNRLDKWINEAAQCGLSYGKYRMMIEHFGKTFEELRL